VGAAYLLSMLVGAEPRGLPGTTINKIALQRAPEGSPLDDVIVCAHDAQGSPAKLEIQVKKGLTFAPGDKVFREVVGQIVRASRNADFKTIRYELGIAISRTSHRIDGPYQTVLTWARQIGDAATFVSRINRPGSGNPLMRSFVETFRAHLQDEGASHDDEAVWQLLRRMQILVFDFAATGSASEELAKERAARALHADDAGRAGNLWSELVELSIAIAKSGGDRTSEALKEDLGQKGFRLAGDRHNQSALATLAEASEHCLADIEDRVAGVFLTRHQYVASVHDALDRGRYVEIRGDAGVGKSAVLKHFAEQALAEGRIVALSPGRTVGKGAAFMLSFFHFDGTARQLLADLAASGGAFLLIDRLDFFSEDERCTVVDLVRDAAKIRGISVIVTARRDFDVDEPNWLPSDALDVLGRTGPVVINELSDDETEELREAAPQLASLLADGHPARAVARNLFRLSRLARRPFDAQLPRTEAEMAEEWWQSADGKRGDGHRERSRVLAALADQAFARIELLSVKDLQTNAVDALVKSETLRNRGNDRVVFRHDVLREWAIASALVADIALLERLPLDRPAPPDLGRGVELAARLAIERGKDAELWHQFLISTSKEGVNGSWRRAVLLALVRSEVASEALTKASGYLLAEHGALLAELVRTVMAVDGVPVTKYFAAAGHDPQSIPAGIIIPSAPSWGRLILWLLELGVGLPAGLLPDVATLYTNWSLAGGGRDPLTPIIVQWLYRWLSEIMDAARSEPPRRPFNGELAGRLGALVEDLKTGFLLFCNHAPGLAADYLEALKQQPFPDRVREEILKFRGSLAQAAPKELAELTAEVLIPTEEEEEEYRRGPMPDPFGHADLIFVPASPAQGPFLELLVHAPEHGLPLIRRLADHAVKFFSRGRDFGQNAMTIAFLDGSKVVFPWYQTYNWSREAGSGTPVLASALMALEAWSHQRIEAGEPVDKVVADVIGAANPPAAYLLVAVDLLLSHWPQSSDAAIPFLGCPELLSYDLQRPVADNVELPDYFGLKALQNEPVGLASIESLKARPSRRISLDQLLGEYSSDKLKEQRTVLAGLLSEAARRLGAPKPGSDLGAPDFMVVHALNMINPDNWRDAIFQGKAGPIKGREYIAPAAESAHLKLLQDASRERQTNHEMRLHIRIALMNPERSSPDFAAEAVKWAEKVKGKPVEDETEQRIREEAIVTAAAIAARDGALELISEKGVWIRETFAGAFKGENDPVHRSRVGLQFNPIAIAFFGTVCLLRQRFAMKDVHTLLEVAADENPAVAQAFVYVAAALSAIDERLPRAILRCAFAACQRPYRLWGVKDEEYEASVERRREEVKKTVDAEFTWLNGQGNEPEWPAFELEYPHTRHHVGPAKWREEREKPQPELYTDHQAAALWLSNASGIFDVGKQPWLRDIVKTYSTWTYVANGSELEEAEDPDRTPDHWNEAYFKLVSYCLPGLTVGEIDGTVLGPVTALPGEAFLDIMTIFLRNVDTVYFSDRGLSEAEAVHVRAALARKLLETRLWKWQSRDSSTSIFSHLGPAVAVVFFNDYASLVPAKCYLLEKDIGGLGPFLPVLDEVVQEGTFFFVALTLLNLLQVSPRPEHLPLVVTAGRVWFAAHPDDKAFWGEQGVGRRLCSIIETIMRLDPKVFARNQAGRLEIESLLASLIRLGVSDAHLLEEAIRLNDDDPVMGATERRL
jgi:hypothetical protein